MKNFHSLSVSALTKRWDDIVVADMVAEIVADMVAHMVADFKVAMDKVTDMEVDKVAGMKVDKVVDMVICMGHTVWAPKWRKDKVKQTQQGRS